MALWKRRNTWWADVTVNGERFRQSLKTSDKREAKACEKELIARRPRRIQRLIPQ